MKTRNLNLLIDTISNGGYFFLRFLSTIILYGLFLDTFDIDSYFIIAIETLIIILILVVQDFHNKDSSIISIINQTKL